MILVYFLLFIIFLLICINYDDWQSKAEYKKQQHEQTKNFQKLYKSWSNK